MDVSKIKFTPVDTETRKKMDFRAGDTIRVWSKIPEEKGKFRLQAFEGIVLARKHGRENGATFTVRKVSSGIGVERIFPLYSPMVDKIEIVKKARARRKMRSVTLAESEEPSAAAEPEKEMVDESK